MALPRRTDLQELMPRDPEEGSGLAPRNERGRPAFGISDGTGAIDRVPLAFYWALLRQHAAKLFTAVLLFTVLVEIAVLALPKEYVSTALLRVDPFSSRVVGDAGPSSNGQVDAGIIVTTEAEVIKSPAVVLQTMQNLNLGANPEFSSIPGGAAGGDKASDQLLQAVTKRITVDQPVGTVLLRIGFRSHNPALSAQVSNGLAAAFLDHEYTTRAKALTDSRQYMNTQIDSLRAQMESDEEALVRYESTHDVIDPDNKENIYQSRLSQINADLSAAESERMKAESDYQIASGGDLDALLASPRGQELQPLKQRLTSDTIALGHLASIYGPKHPLYQQQLALVASDQAALSDQEQLITQEIASHFAAAVKREQLIAAALAQQKNAMDAFNQRAIPYHSLKAASDSSTKLYYDLLQRIQDATVASGLRSEDLRVISPARPAELPVYPRPLLSGILAALLGTIIAVGGTIAWTLMDQTVSSADQIENLFGVSVIGVLPAAGNRDPAMELERYLAPGDAPTSKGELSRSTPYREAVLGLQNSLQFLRNASASAWAITSSVPGEGKSTTSSQLASALAGLGARIVLIDADMRKPRLHKLFGVSNQTGLSSLLRAQCAFEDVLIHCRPNFAVMPAGPPTATPVELLQQHMAQVIGRAKNEFDYVLLDCPPLLGFADCAAISSMVDGVALVVLAGQTDQRLIRAALRTLHGVRASLLGLILNRVNVQRNGHYGYYNSSYYSQDSEVDDEIEA